MISVTVIISFMERICSDVTEIPEISNLLMSNLPLDPVFRFLTSQQQLSIFLEFFFDRKSIFVSEKNDKIVGVLIFGSTKAALESYLSKLNFSDLLKLFLHNLKPFSFFRVLIGFFIFLRVMTNNSLIELSWIVVDVNWRRKQIGQDLVRFSFVNRNLIHFKGVWVKTLESNGSAVQFYTKLGFRYSRTLLGRSFFIMELES